MALLFLSACGPEPASVECVGVSSPAEPPETSRSPQGSPQRPPARELRYLRVGPPQGESPLVILLHGYGAPGDDMLPLARRIHERTGARVVCPAAPLPEGRGRAWWRLTDAPRPADYGELHPAGLDEARADVIALLEDLRREGVLEPERTVLAGFSQGAMLATDVALTWESPVAGLAVLSGAPLTESDWRHAMARRSPPRVLLTHGSRDPLLAFEAAQRLGRHFEAAGSETRFVEFDGRHAIPDVAIDALLELVRQVD